MGFADTLTQTAMGAAKGVKDVAEKGGKGAKALGKGLQKAHDLGATKALRTVGEVKAMTDPDPRTQLGVMAASYGGWRPKGSSRAIAQGLGHKRRVQAQAQKSEAASQGANFSDRNTATSSFHEMAKNQSLDVDLPPSSKRRLEEVKDDMKALEKEANIGASEMPKEADSGRYLKDIGRNTAIGAGTALGTLGLYGAYKGGKGLWDKVQSERSWKKLQQDHPELADEDTREHFGVLKRYAPSLAKDPTVARGYLERAQKMNWTPHESVRELAETENAISRSQEPPIRPMEAVSEGRKMEQMKRGSLEEASQERFEKESSGSSNHSFQDELDQLDPR